jgi:SOS response regulatory protein OraA/RecX
MDREKHGENFSSPNVNLTVTSIQGGTAREGSQPACRVELSSGSSFFISLDDLINLGIQKGTEVGEALKNDLRTAHRRRRVRAKALDYLNRRDHSRRELLNKLEKRFLYPRQKPHSPPPPPLKPEDREEYRQICQDVAEDMVRLGFVDDLRYARNWVVLRLKRHPEGLSALSAGLARHGVDREVIDQALLPYREGDTASDALDRAGAKLLNRSKRTGAGIMRSLLQKGFSYPEIRRWMEEKGIDPRGLEPGDWD